jgi:RNA polymerase sigma factor (sigma-70 family)
MVAGNGGSNSDERLLFTVAYRQYAATVNGYLRSQGLADPEAVTQDVFLALFPRLAEISGGSDGLRALLFSIAHARVVDHHRRRSTAPSVSEYDPESDLRTTHSAEDVALAAHSHVQVLLHSLPDDYREVLALRIIADLSLEGTAQIMGKTTGAVKQLQRRALAALRTQLTMNAESTS